MNFNFLQAPHTMTEEVAALHDWPTRPDSLSAMAYRCNRCSSSALYHATDAGIRFEAERAKTKLPNEWQKLIDQLGFQEFTPFKEQLFNPILEGETLLRVSPTGTGKTLATISYLVFSNCKRKSPTTINFGTNTICWTNFWSPTRT